MSKRKQKLKKADFQKTKLKVGKTAPKPKNYTDTSFTAKIISIKDQHLTLAADKTASPAYYRKRLSLLRHHNSNIRKETLEQFQREVPSLIKSNIMTSLLRQAIPLMCDPMGPVRDAVLGLLKTIGDTDRQALVLHCNLLVLYIHMAMTHITPGIQAQSTGFLRCLLDYCGMDIVRQGWVKLLNGNLTVLGWGGPGKSTSGGGGSVVLPVRKRDSKYARAHLDGLRELIRYGCSSSVLAGEDGNGSGSDSGSGLVDRYSVYLIPSMPQPYGYLKLFTRELNTGQGQGGTITMSSNDSADTTATKSAASTTTTATTTSSFVNQDIDTRRQLFKRQYLQYILDRAAVVSKEGGEVGRSANSLRQLLLEIF